MAYNDVTADTLTQLALDEQNERERLEKRALRNRYAQLFRNAPTPNVQPVEPDSPMTIAELEALAKSDPKDFIATTGRCTPGTAARSPSA